MRRRHVALVSALGGTVFGIAGNPAFARIVAADLCDGQHRNDTGNPAYFTTAYFHRPEDLLREVEEAGLADAEVLGVEGPGWLAGNFDALWDVPATRISCCKSLPPANASRRSPE